jgi:hypothetical protein
MNPEDLTPLNACPACGGIYLVPSETIHKPYRLVYSRCRDCNLIFMNPMPRQAWYDRFYASAFWEGKSGANPDKELRAQLGKEADRAHAVVDFLSGATLGEGLAIEIGCAYGMLIRSVSHRLGLVPAGIEPSDGARAFAARHIHMLGKSASDIATIDTDRPVALIIMSNVLENIVDPASVLRTIRARFSAHVVIATPDPLRSRAVSLYHPFVYSASALSALLTRTGFDVLRHARDPRDPQAQMFLAAPGSGTSVVSGAHRMFTMRRRLGLFRSRMSKRGGKRPLRLEHWDRQAIADLLSDVR